MAHFANVGAVQSLGEYLLGKPEAHRSILDWLDETLESQTGLDLDLLVFSEGVEFMAQTPETQDPS